MSDTDDQDHTIKALRARCAELEAKLHAADTENAQLKTHALCLEGDVVKLREYLAQIYDAQNG